MKKGYNVRDQHSASTNNKKFVKLHEMLTERFSDEEIAKAAGIAQSTYGKVKLGYYPAYDYRIEALRNVVNAVNGTNVTAMTAMIAA